MTPQQFHDTYRSCADQVSAGTNIDPIALLAQWANETAWGQAIFGNNLGNIRCSPTSFCLYASLDEFAAACIATFHNGYYQAVLDATNATDQLAAIVASPWSAGHYGGSLDAYYQPLEEFELTPDEHNWLKALYNQFTSPTYATADARTQAVLDAVAKIPTGSEPPEPAEPKNIVLNIPGVPGTATGTIS